MLTIARAQDMKDSMMTIMLGGKVYLSSPKAYHTRTQLIRAGSFGHSHLMGYLSYGQVSQRHEEDASRGCESVSKD
jgi:hypothetical protein